MCGTSVTRGMHVILVTTVFIFKLVEHEVASEVWHNATAHTSKITYREIDHRLVPRKIENINEMSPLPVPPGGASAMKKYRVSKRKVQDIILEIDEKKQVNNLKNTGIRPSPSQISEYKVRQKKLKSILGTDGEVYYDADWGLMSAVLTCYNNHWALKTGPEDWWTVVIRRIVQAMDEYAEVPQVRNFFVGHEGKKKLKVVVGPTLSNIDYNWLFSQISNKIRENIKRPTYVDIIENDFSSSTDEHKIISHIMLMSSVKSYFDFNFGTACGIPGIEMKGTEKDWVKLNEKINELEKLLGPILKYLHFNDWFNTTKTVFTNLLDTYKGHPNIEWWGNILSWNQVWGSGERSYWDGWFPEFFGALHHPGDYFHFPSDLVTVPIHISDNKIPPPVEDDGILVAGIVGFNVEAGVRAPVVEPKHAWSLLLPEDSPLADALSGGNTEDATSHNDGSALHLQPTNPKPFVSRDPTISYNAGSALHFQPTATTPLVSQTNIFANRVNNKDIPLPSVKFPGQ